MEKFLSAIALVAVSLIGAIILSPCLLMFTQDAETGMPTVFNLIGLVYFVAITLIFRRGGLVSKSHKEEEE